MWPCPSQRWLLSCGGEIGWSATATSQAHVTTGFDRRAEDDNVVAPSIEAEWSDCHITIDINQVRFLEKFFPEEVLLRSLSVPAPPIF